MCKSTSTSRDTTAESTEFGFVGVLNDLHKDRDVDVIWYSLVNVRAVLLVAFSSMGLVQLLPSQSRFLRVTGYTGIAAVLVTAG